MDPQKKRITVKPPERGIFPLDHDQECKNSVKLYLDCLASHSFDHLNCRNLAKGYLACRMESGLMKSESFDLLGFSPEDESQRRERFADVFSLIV